MSVFIAVSFVITSSSATKLPLSIIFFLSWVLSDSYQTQNCCSGRLKAWVCKIAFYILRPGESLGVYIFNNCSLHSLLLQFQRKHHKCNVNIFPKYWECVLITKYLFSSECYKLMTVDFIPKLAFYSIKLSQQILFIFILSSFYENLKRVWS